jgi:hypothetical protein
MMAQSNRHQVGEGPFRLLVRADGNDKAADTLLLGGFKWRLSDWGEVPGDGTAPDYSCVSYAWGQTFVPHLFDPSDRMSARALPAAEAVIAAFAPRALWIDALCVPSSGPARRACLRSLGAIYGSASQVVAVLSSACAPALERLARGDHGWSVLGPLESDGWIARAWTYQEIVNSRAMHFVAEGGGASHDATALLNVIGQSMLERERALGIDAFALKTLHPRLDALQDLLGDWQVGDYLERPAFQILSGMSARDATRDDDRYDAMIGVVERVPAEPVANTTPVPAPEAFLRACEAKGDFSYIYAAAPRGDESGRSWRPLSQGPLHAVLSWHSYGSGQSGQLTPTHLRLNDMVILRRGSVGVKARTFICDWLGIDTTAFDARDAGERAYRRLRDAGFNGVPTAIESEEGLVFTQSLYADAATLDVAVPTGVRWVHGAPALLLKRRPDGERRFRDVGVFIGPVADAGDSIDVV